MAWSDGELVLETLAGDREAFGKLVDRHRRTMFAVALQRGFQPAEAEDLTQEIFVKAYRSLKDLQEPENFARWLYGIAAHVTADAARNRKRHADEVRLENAPEVPAAIDSSHENREESGEIMRALRELPDAQRLVLTLRYVEGLTPKEIALRLGQPRGTIRSQLHHALGYLQTAFGAKKSERVEK